MDLNKNNCLEYFGKLVVENAHDYLLKGMFYKILDSSMSDGLDNKWKQILVGLDKKDLAIMELVLHRYLDVYLFELLKIFEENDEFKLSFSNGTEMIELKDLSGFLPSEGAREDGWFENYSECFIKKFQNHDLKDI